MDIRECLRVLGNQRPWLNDVVLDVAASLMIQRPDVCWISSLNIHNTLAHESEEDWTEDPAERSARIRRLLGLRETNHVITLLPLNGPHGHHSRKNDHWSLLVYWKEQNTFFHYDSIHGYNQNIAQELVQFLSRENVIASTGARFVEPKSLPRQRQSWECGFYVLRLLDIIVSKPVAEPLRITELKQTHAFDFTPEAMQTFQWNLLNRFLEVSNSSGTVYTEQEVALDTFLRVPSAVHG